MPSTVIEYARYNADGKYLDIKYRSGRTYRYIDVPESEYESYRRSHSKGHFLNSVIKKKYKFERLH